MLRRLVRERISKTSNKAWNVRIFLACVASVSVRFRSKERGTRVWGRKEGNFLPFPLPPLSFFWLLFHFSRGQNLEYRSSVFLCSETKRKRLLCRLAFSNRCMRLPRLKDTCILGDNVGPVCFECNLVSCFPVHNGKYLQRRVCKKGSSWRDSYDFITK